MHVAFSSPLSANPGLFSTSPGQHGLTRCRSTVRNTKLYTLNHYSTSRVRACIAEDSSKTSSIPTQHEEKVNSGDGDGGIQRYYETFKWRGYNINYLSEGKEDGNPILFIHGFGASINHWRKNIPEVLQSDENHHVYAIDLLGLGASDKANPKEVTYSIEIWTELIVDFIKSMNKDKNKKWNLIGNSIGSLICLSAANQLGQDYIRCCILMNCAGGMVSFRYSDLNIFQRIIFLTFNTLLFNPVVGKYLFEYIRKSDNLKNVLKQIYIDESTISNELVSILSTPAFDDGACEVFLAILNGQPGPRPEDLLSKIQWCPILTLWGEKDPWTPLYEGFHPGVKFPDYHNGLILEPIANAGHCIHDEVPELVNPQVISFLKCPTFRDSNKD